MKKWREESYEKKSLAFLFVRLAGHGVFVCTDCRADYLLV